VCKMQSFVIYCIFFYNIDTFKQGMCTVMYLCVRVIEFASFSICFWSCSDSVVFLFFILFHYIGIVVIVNIVSG